MRETLAISRGNCAVPIHKSRIAPMPDTLNQKTKRWDSFEESLLDLAQPRADSDESDSDVSLYDSDDGQDTMTSNADLALERDTRTIDEILQDRAKALERAARSQDEALH